MKKTIFTLSAIVALAFTGCMQDEAPPILEDPGNSGTVGNNTVSVSGMISESTTTKMMISDELPMARQLFFI